LFDPLGVFGILVNLLKVDHGVFYVFIGNEVPVLGVFVGTRVGEVVEHFVE